MRRRLEGVVFFTKYIQTKIAILEMEEYCIAEAGRMCGVCVCDVIDGWIDIIIVFEYR